MDDGDMKLELFIYLILGVSEYLWIKIDIKLRIGKVVEFIVELCWLERKYI